VVWRPEFLEPRLVLTAVVAPADPVIYANAFSGVMSPEPGHTMYVAGFDSQGTRLSPSANASAITPNTSNDLVLGVIPYSTDYVATSPGAGGTLGASLLTNGLTQSQVAPSGPGQAALGDAAADDPSSNLNTISDLTHGTYFFNYNLGTSGGAAGNASGYDISEIDIITGNSDVRESIFAVDVLVQPVGSNQFVSLSGGQGFSLVRVPKPSGGTTTFDNGSVQMAIVNDAAGQPLAQNVQAVQLLVLDASSFFREFVVTGTPSGGLPVAPAAPTSVATNFSGGAVAVSWNASAGAVGYSVMRSTSSGGPFLAVGSVVGATTFVDSTVQPNSTYFYEVAAAGNGDSSRSSPSSALATPSFGATAYLFPSQFWQGAPAITEILPQIDYSGYDFSSQFPVAPSFNTNSFSAFVQGKITTTSAGRYTFIAPTDDDGYLYVNGQLVSSDPGLNVQGRSPAATFPIMLAANTAYDFIFLENNRIGQWTMDVQWQPPGAGAPVDVPAMQFTPNVDAPPTPSQPTARLQADNTVKLSWTATGDASSFAYLVQRAPADANGNPTGSFTTIGRVFSGPTTPGDAGAATWGATTDTDVTAQVGVAYVYRVGAILIGESLPAAFSAASTAVTPGPSLSAAISGSAPASTVAGEKTKIVQTVTLENGGKSAVSGNFTGQLFLSITPSIGSNSIQLTSATRSGTLKPRGRLRIKLAVGAVPVSTGAGTYFLVGRVTDSAGNTSDAASPTVFVVQQAMPDLTGAFINTPVPAVSGATRLTFTISNAGNTTLTGPLAFNVDRSTDGLLADATVITNSSTSIVLKPGRSRRVSLRVTLPAGSYFVLIQLDPQNTLHDVNLSDNTLVSASKVTVG
jgi:hypothetical protein